MPQFPLISAFVLMVLMAARIVSGSDGAGAVESSALLLGFVENHCLECHDSDTRKADLDLEAILSDPAQLHAGIWETVVRRLESREMPPPGRDRPGEQSYRAAVSKLTAWLDAEAKRRPKPGRTETIRRLTRTEYGNAVRDLFGLEIDVSELLPKDSPSQGFDNITVGDLSPTLLDRYVSAAQKISRLAVGRDPGSAQLRVIRIPADRTQEKHVEGLPLGTRGGALVDHVFPVSGEYEFEIRLARDRNEHVEGLRGSHQLEVLIDRERVAGFTVKPPGGKDHSKVDSHLNVRLPVEAGSRAVGVAFIKESSSLLETRRQPYDAQFNMHRHPRSTPALFQVSISGPFSVHREKDKVELVRELTGRPPGGENDERAARDILSVVMSKAYRRTLEEGDFERPLRFFREANRKEGFSAGLEMALSSVLVSPRFLFRVENDPPGLAPGSVYAVDDFDLASRLSFFLWSSLPDEELLAAAKKGDLSKPGTLEKQARRMLKDPKAESLAANFAAQWLHLRNLDSVTRNLRLFPDFDDNLRQAFRRESEMMVEEVVRNDLPVHTLLRSDYTFLNERLARHYGIPRVSGSRFRRVALVGDHQRGGLLRHGSILTVTSYANRTSPVIRGNWILENILGTPTPPPPPEVPALDDSVVSASLPIRERLAAHSKDKACAVCHVRIDPLGFALENFDAVGRWREAIDGKKIDAAGGFSDGRKFAGVTALEDALLERPDLFARTLTEKLLTFALGRGMESYDAPAVRAILREAQAKDFRFSDIVAGIVKSTPFTHRTSQ